MELSVVAVIIGILASIGIPSFQRGLEQSRTDLAAANLRSIWSAQRLYWLENREYAPDLATLESLELLDSAVASQVHFTFAITSADADTFTAIASRASNTRWNGTLIIDQSGVVSGYLMGAGEPNIIPSNP